MDRFNKRNTAYFEKIAREFGLEFGQPCGRTREFYKELDGGEVRTIQHILNVREAYTFIEGLTTAKNFAETKQTPNLIEVEFGTLIEEAFKKHIKWYVQKSKEPIELSNEDIQSLATRMVDSEFLWDEINNWLDDEIDQDRENGDY